MAIIHTNDKNEITYITNKGMVVKTGYEVVQVMSDVYEDWHYGIVYDVVTDTATKIYARAEVDASEELIAQYEKMCENERRHAEAVHRWHDHNLRIEQAHLLSLSVREFKKLKRTYGGRMYEGCWDLLKTKKFRNKFRESLAIQLRTWLSETDNKFPFPFSHKQAQFVMPYSRW